MKVTVIPIVVGAHGTVAFGLEKRLKKMEIRGKFKTLALLTYARILRSVLETRRDLLSLRLQ